MTLSRPGRAVLSDRRLTHIREIHRAGEGDRLRVGPLQGGIGSALIERMIEREVTLALTLQEGAAGASAGHPDPGAAETENAEALSGMVAEMGAASYLINSVRVEKSHWQSPWLHPEKIHGSLLPGLEQARDTMLPEVHLRRRFKPFVEDELPGWIDSGLGLLAHPAAPGFSESGLRSASPAVAVVHRAGRRLHPL